jgi:DegV family protein with EDD domain
VSTVALSRRYSPVHRIDGAWFARLVTAGARWVCAHREELNRINVFPVVDGDTGTNMAATLRAVARSIQKAGNEAALPASAKAAAEGCLMGARGNSGMILCHIFSSLSAGVGEQESLEPRELARILRTASADLYRALDTPVEGTILTVLRESTAHGGLDSCADLESLIALLVREARIALDKTPEQLEVLRNAQVVDSGALGYVYFLEGMLREVQGQSLPALGDEVAPSPSARKAKVHQESPHFRFCTEVVIESRTPLTTGRLRTLFRQHGDSLIPLLTGRLAKVHIHTNSPEEVFAMAATLGDVVRTKVEDMRTQSQGMFGHEATLPGVRSRTRIVVDSTCDVPPEVLSKWGVQMVPLKVMFGDEALRDRVEILPDEFINRMIISPVHPRTSQPAPDDFAQAFAHHEQSMEGDEEILCMTLSSKLSGTYASAKTARDVKGSRVHLFDVPFASAPFGLLVTRAIELAREGRTAQEIIADLDQMKTRTNILFCLDTLEYMKRGGRISWGQAFLGNLLDLKPILEFQEGKMVPHAKVRSKDKARQRVLDDLLKVVPKDKPVRFMLVHSGRPDQLVPIEEFLQKNFKVSQLMNCAAGAVISAHCGPGAWGIAWSVE